MKKYLRICNTACSQKRGCGPSATARSRHPPSLAAHRRLLSHPTASTLLLGPARATRHPSRRLLCRPRCSRDSVCRCCWVCARADRATRTRCHVPTSHTNHRHSGALEQAAALEPRLVSDCCAARCQLQGMGRGVRGATHKRAARRTHRTAGGCPAQKPAPPPSCSTPTPCTSCATPAIGGLRTRACGACRQALLRLDTQLLPL